MLCDRVSHQPSQRTCSPVESVYQETQGHRKEQLVSISVIFSTFLLNVSFVTQVSFPLYMIHMNKIKMNLCKWKCWHNVKHEHWSWPFGICVWFNNLIMLLRCRSLTDDGDLIGSKADLTSMIAMIIIIMCSYVHKNTNWWNKKNFMSIPTIHHVSWT